MLINVLSRPTDGCGAMREMIARSHRIAQSKEGAHQARLATFFRALRDRKIIEIGEPNRHRRLPARERRVAGRLLDEPNALALLSLESIPLLDREAPDYALDLITLVESIP